MSTFAASGSHSRGKFHLSAGQQSATLAGHVPTGRRYVRIFECGSKIHCHRTECGQWSCHRCHNGKLNLMVFPHFVMSCHILHPIDHQFFFGHNLDVDLRIVDLRKLGAAARGWSPNIRYPPCSTESAAIRAPISLLFGRHCSLHSAFATFQTNHIEVSHLHPNSPNDKGKRWMSTVRRSCMQRQSCDVHDSGI